MNGFSVETANDGVQALGKLKSGSKPDLIITDVNMPNMDGLELIRNVKLLPGFRFTPILTLTTESQTAKRDEAKKLGATGWLVKPVSGPDLVKVIKQVLPGA
jgi:two-component system chemotaxis response regulator CheY